MEQELSESVVLIQKLSEQLGNAMHVSRGGKISECFQACVEIDDLVNQGDVLAKILLGSEEVNIVAPVGGVIKEVSNVHTFTAEAEGNNAFAKEEFGPMFAIRRNKGERAPVTTYATFGALAAVFKKHAKDIFGKKMVLEDLDNAEYYGPDNIANVIRRLDGAAYPNVERLEFNHIRNRAQQLLGGYDNPVVAAE